MGRLRLTVACAIGAFLLVPQGAAAGGWWSYVHLDRSEFAPGERVELSEEVMFDSIAAAEAAERSDRFRVYVLRGFDYAVVHGAMRKAVPGDWWSLGGAEAIEVGRVTIRASDSNLASATAAFTVPELPPATYHLMLCDVGCREPLADLIPTESFTVVSDRPAAAGWPLFAWLIDALEAIRAGTAVVPAGAPPGA